MESVIETLKQNSFVGNLFGEAEDDTVTDEQILNVFRIRIQEGEKVLKTAEVAEELPITSDWTGKRLDDLEEDGRVHSKSAGQGDVWWLDEDEPDFPVSEGMSRWIWISVLTKRDSRFSGTIGLGLAATGGIFLIPYIMLEMVPEMAFWLVTPQNVATVAMFAALIAGLFLMTSFVLRHASKLIRWAVTND